LTSSCLLPLLLPNQHARAACLAEIRYTALVFGLAAGVAAAQPYRWIDEKDGVQYTDALPPAGAKDVQKLQLRDNVIGWQTSYELEKAMRESPVTLYSHPECRDQCQIARDTLNKRGIPFKEVSVDDQPKQDELKRVSGAINVGSSGGSQVETITAQGTTAYDLAGYPPGVAPAQQAAPPEEKQAEAPSRRPSRAARPASPR
jgi:glutaredoxin